MNTCNKLPLYLYNEITAEERTEFEKHLEQCTECKDSLKIFNAVQESKVLRNAPSAVINSIFEKTTRKKSFFSYKFTLAAAACLFIGIGFFSINSRQQPGNVLAYDASRTSLEEISSINSDLDEYDNIFLV